MWIGSGCHLKQTPPTVPRGRGPWGFSSKLAYVHQRVPWESCWTPLLQASIQESSEVEYRRGVTFFLKWLREEYCAPVIHAWDLDVALCEYGWWVFESMGGRGRNRLNNAVFGCEYFLPVFSKQLVMARRSLKGWTLLRPPMAHPPINWGLSCLVAHQLSVLKHVGAGVWGAGCLRWVPEGFRVSKSTCV